LLSGCSSSQLTTIEGDPFLHQNAKDYLSRFGDRVDVVLGNFDDVLPQILPTKKWDLVIIDGNHRGEALLNYFHQIKPHLSENAWVLMDDIHWSPDMTNAWNDIVANCGGKLTLDFFQWGAYLQTERNQKEHFTLRY
jgi:predicted O-methyltransferase YrrM